MLKLRKSDSSFILSLLLSCFMGSAQQGWMIGGGPSLELDHDLLGINGRVFYGPNSQFCFGPEFTIFPYKEINGTYELNIIDLNINGHFVFELSDALAVYPLSGINYTIENERLIANNENVERKSEFGFNYGLGMHYNLNHFFMILEFKGIAGQLSDEFVTAGLIFPLMRSQNKKEH